MNAPRSQPRRWPWLVAAALLFGIGAWVMAGSEAKTVEKPDKVSIPRYMTSDERKRNAERRTLPAQPEPPPVDGQKALPPPPRDPVLAGLPSKVKNGAVVIEANAIRHSDLGDLMVECVFTGSGDVLGHMRDAGFDPLENLDRLAIADDILMLTGDFANADFKRLGPMANERDFGANAKLMTPLKSDGGLGGHVGVWKGQVVVIGETEEQVTTVLDRLEGKRPADERPILGEQDQYGEMYGVLNAKPFADDLRDENPQLARLLEEAASSIRLHADVTHDVGVVAEVEGTDATKTQDLRKAIGSALTLAKLQAQAKGKDDAAEVLGFAKVAQAKNGSANFNLEAGLPYEFLERQLKRCVENQKKRAAQPDDDD